MVCITVTFTLARLRFLDNDTRNEKIITVYGREKRFEKTLTKGFFINTNAHNFIQGLREREDGGVKEKEREKKGQGK